MLQSKRPAGPRPWAVGASGGGDDGIATGWLIVAGPTPPHGWAGRRS